MNEAFFALPQEKQQRIINAAMEVFAKNPYKRASTDDIAAKAGISKGLLFYYFHNKQELYLHLFQYGAELMETLFSDFAAALSVDFFEMLEQGAELKATILEKSPAIMDFYVRAFYDRESEAAQALGEAMTKKMGSAFTMYFSRVDFSKFREGVDPMYVLRMLTWMADGYLNEKQRMNVPVRVEELMKDFRIWAVHFKKMAYKDEFIDRGGADK